MKRTIHAFTLIELMVVVAIFLVITGIILANNSRFNSSVLLDSLAYDIALSIREAQVYGLSVQTFNSNFQVGYGVDFSASSPNSYILFADVNENNHYDPGTDTVLDTYAVGVGHFIKSFCGTYANSTTQCSTDSSGPITQLDIVFLRPEPDANMSSSLSSGYYSSVQIVVGSLTGGETRTITIQSTGQISVNNPSSNP